MIRRIKELLYEEGYTIAGAKKRLQSELEDGRSFAAPEVDGELFTAEGEGEDEVPVIPVEPPGSHESDEPAESAPSEESVKSSVGVEASTRADSTNEPPRDEPPIEPVPPPLVEAVASAATPTPTPSPSRRGRGRAGKTVEARAAKASAAAPGAVDSALSERVETLEHGLRRVLAEVKHLRTLLAEPSADR